MNNRWLTLLFIAVAGLMASSATVLAGSMTLLGVGGPAAGPTTATWNPADDSANNALSNGNKTVTRGAAAGANSLVRATRSASSGKKYFEIHVDNLVATNTVLLGICNSTLALTNGPGFTADGGGAFDSANFFINSNVIGTTNGWSTGLTVGIAIDFTNQLIWYINSSSLQWNGSGTPNPATGVGGFSLATMNAGPYFPCLNTFTNLDAFTANFGATAYTIGAPSGFGNF